MNLFNVFDPNPEETKLINDFLTLLHTCHEQHIRFSNIQDVAMALFNLKYPDVDSWRIGALQEKVSDD